MRQSVDADAKLADRVRLLVDLAVYAAGKSLHFPRLAADWLH